MSNLFTLENKLIVITGASSGIGRASAILCNELGAKVILIARRKEELVKTQEMLSIPSLSKIVSLDLMNPVDFLKIIDNIVNEQGKISGFIHSAGIESTEPLKLLSRSHLLDMFQINVFSGIEFTKIITKKKYCDQEGVSIVFIASIMSMLGQPGKVAYSSSKSALIAMSKSMALELAPRSIRVNCISPAMINSPLLDKMFSELPESAKINIKKMHPMGFGEPEDVAHAVAYLLSNASKWVTGTNLIIDGGYSAH